MIGLKNGMKKKLYSTSTEKLYGLAEYHVEDIQQPISNAIENSL